MKYTYNEFVEYRDLANVIKESIPILESRKIDPHTFYTFIIENPALLDHKTPEEIAQIFLEAPWGTGWIPDAAKAVGGAFSGWGAKGRAKTAQDDMNLIQNDKNFSHLNKPEIMSQLQKDKATADAQAGRGFFGNMADAWKGARGQRATDDASAAKDAEQAALDQKVAMYNQRFQQGPFAPGTPQPQNQGQGGGQGNPPPPQPQNQGGGFNPVATAQALVNKYQKSRHVPKEIIKALMDIINNGQPQPQPTP